MIEGEKRVLERNARLSESMLWTLSREFYTREGPLAWMDSIVPAFPTTNAFAARAQARVVARFLLETGAQNATILELGAGTGLFGFRFLGQLSELAHARGGAFPDYRYVMTDVASKNVALWQNHPSLEPFVRAGQLVFDTFDVTRPDRALPTGHPDGAADALVVIANYVMDSIAHDVFTIAAGGLGEVLVNLEHNEGAKLPPVLPDITASWTRRPASLPYYGDPELDAILESYTNRLGETDLPFPIAALRVLQRVFDEAPGPVMLLCADKGYVHEAELCQIDGADYALHGSASMMVNFHAIAELCKSRGGQSLITSPRDVGAEETSIVAAAFLGGGGPYWETAHTFHETMEQFGPGDFADLRLLGALEPRDGASLAELLAMLRLSAWDGMVFLRMASQLADASAGLERESTLPLRQALDAVGAGFYPFDPEEDVAFGLAVVLHAMGEYRRAIEWFERSECTFGPNAEAAHNRGLCFYSLGELDHALAEFEAALRLAPTFGPSREGRLRVLLELGSD